MANTFEDNSLAALAHEIDSSARTLIFNTFSEKMIPEEEDFTAQLLLTINGIVNGFRLQPKITHSYSPMGTTANPTVQLNSYVIHARPLLRKGSKSEEKKTGADMLFFFESKEDNGDLKTKGFLAQAKKNNGNFNQTSDKDLFDQCEKMHKITDDSYVAIYAPNGLHIFTNPIGTTTSKLRSKDITQTLGEVVAAFVDCTVGDEGITEKRVGSFAEAAEKLRQNRIEEAAKAAKLQALVISANPTD